MTTVSFKPKLFSTLRHYDRQQFMTDLLAGIIVGIVALPLAIAFGIASGVTPEKGIITAIVAGLIVSVFGGSKVQIGGPTGAFIIIIYGIIQQYGFEGLTIATLMAGVFLIMFGILHLGTIIKYIPYPIIVGFTSGIALTIFTTQIKDLFGLTMASVPSDFIEKWIAYFSAFPTIDVWSAGVGVLSVAVIALWPRLTRHVAVGKLPGSLIAIIVMTLAVLLLKHQWGIRVSPVSRRSATDLPSPISCLVLRCLCSHGTSSRASYRLPSPLPSSVPLSRCSLPLWRMVSSETVMTRIPNSSPRVWQTWQVRSSAVFLPPVPSPVR